MSDKHPRVLIVGTIPYNPNTSSRAFDAYFHNWEKENICQVFSNTKTPIKGHCEKLYQITDKRMLKRRFSKKVSVGVRFEDENLPLDWENNDLEVGGRTFNFLYKMGSKESAFKHMARKVIWKEKYWNTEDFRDWIDSFKPEAVFLAFSDDFFILEIALFVARRFDIPIMSCIGDDYYFNDKKKLSPIYRIYRKKYKALVRDVFKHGGSAIYIGDKIRDKYNSEFGLTGETVYLTSTIARHDFRPIDKENLRVSYCGNIRLGRNTSLVDIGNALQEINPQYKVDVYSAEKNKEFIEPLLNCRGIDFHGSVPYSRVMEIMAESDILVIVEGFTKEQIDTTKYSLSTKAADSMATGGQILTYGSPECGVIEYMQSVHCSVVCTSKENLTASIANLIDDQALQKELYDKCVQMSFEHHDKDRNLQISEALFERMIADFKEKKHR